MSLSFGAQAQQSYFTSQGEYIFSWSGYNGGGINGGQTRTRFTLFPNSEFMYNLDSKGLLGTYFGLSIRNVGFNWKDSEGDRHKRRALSVGVPLVIKLGDLENDNFFFFGGEAEVFFHYKKKDWAPDGTKSKFTEFMSDELNLFQPSAMVGYCKNHFMFKVKYYFNDFFNESFTNSLGEQPYVGLPSNIFYFSIAFRQEMGNNDFEEEDNDDEGDQGFDFGYNLRLHDIYKDI